jgi:SAM-dependent methyltransferase
MNGRAADEIPKRPKLLSDADRDYLVRNRAAWQQWADEYKAVGRRAWNDEVLRWGMWALPESDLRLLKDVRPGDGIIELGCGTASVSAWLARRGLQPVAIDLAPAQLATASQLQHEFGIAFPIFCANAEEVDIDASTFDVAISDYGASLWCEPGRWLREAHRLLRPGGRLIFLTNGAMLMTCTPPDGGPAEERLVRDYFSSSRVGRVEFGDDGPVEFHLTHGEWVRVLRSSGFVLEDLIEVRPPPGRRPIFDFVTWDWAQRWPSEEIWVARKAA